MADPGSMNAVIGCELLNIQKYAAYAFVGQLFTKTIPLDFCSLVNSVYLVASGYIFVELFVKETAIPPRQNRDWKLELVRIGTDGALTLLGWILSQALFRIVGIPYFEEAVPFSMQQAIKEFGWIWSFFFILSTGFVVTCTTVAIVRLTHNVAVNLYRYAMKTLDAGL